ncbi:hypothetical protein [Roseateles sp. P5_E1]
MKPFTPALALVLALAGCAAPVPPGHGAHAAAADGARKEDGKGGGKGGGMMDEMCKRHAAEPGRAASAPGSMMDKHCQARAEVPAGAASHAH